MRRLGDVVDLFTNVRMAEKGDTRDILGRTYEYCLSKFAEQEGKNAGEFYTPLNCPKSASMPRMARFIVAIFQVVGLLSWP